MKTLMMGFAFTLAATAAFATEPFKNVALVDVHCADKSKDDPDAHPRTCLMSCAAGGLGVFLADGRYVHLDAAGNEKALALVKASDKKDHLRVDVTGTLRGEVLEVESIAFAK